MQELNGYKLLNSKCWYFSDSSKDIREKNKIRIKGYKEISNGIS